MNVKFTNRESDKVFCKALEESPDAKKWLLGKMTGYNTSGMKTTLEISIDPYYRGEEEFFKDFSWAIYSQRIDDYGVPVDPIQPIINGGLIYRGNKEYTSHT